jgi:hypothetical protein
MTLVEGDSIFVVLVERFEPFCSAKPLGYSVNYSNATKLLEFISVREAKGNWDYQTRGDPFYDGVGPIPDDMFITWLSDNEITKLFEQDETGGRPMQGIICVAPINVESDDEGEDDDGELEEGEIKPAVEEKKEDVVIPDATSLPVPVMIMDEDADMDDNYDQSITKIPLFRGRKVLYRYLICRTEPTLWDYMEEVTEGDRKLLEMNKAGTVVLPQEYLQNAMSKLGAKTEESKTAEPDSIPPTAAAASVPQMKKGGVAVLKTDVPK